MDLRVATYNIHKSVGPDGRRRPDRIFRVLRELDADVVALQEVDRRFGDRASTFEVEELRLHTGFRLLEHSVRPHSSGWHGNAILVRGVLEPLQLERLHLPALEARGALLADLRVGERGELRMIAAHLGLLRRYRHRQVEAILEHLEDAPKRPTIMVGDLNEWRARGGCIPRLARDFHVATPGASFPAWRPLLGLDRVMARDGARVVDARVHDTPASREASDHLPVVADVRLRAA
ncbi:MAG: endonuclease/exonuclease/phosphatase family protein [Myxococcota bacterium]